MQRSTLTLLTLLGAFALLIWLAPVAVLTGFGGILTAVALRSLALPIARRTPLNEATSVLAVSLLILLLAAAGVWLAAEALMEEARQFAQRLPEAWQAASTRLRDLPGGAWIIEQIPSAGELGDAAGGAARTALAGLSGALGGLGTFVLILLLGVYLAADPATYRRGLLRLLAPSLRLRAARTLYATADTLRGWLLGQAFAMMVTGMLTFLGLWLLGVPLAGLLAVLSALFGFVPYVGPIVGGVPAVLIALGQDPSLVPWVVGLVLLVQNVEGNILTPLVQQRSADIPPALLLGAQLLFGGGLGILGVVLAAPVAAALVTAVRVGYVEAWVEPPDEEPAPTG
ncbi:AI-2E family transporter [Roseomonas sp. CCTCC AB2023176]|uniref:AI-2E family transporter n=1 Tax=Roseomonas sp. CCTCC AB2023176 TaxID=3342640 RepID=UPI0035DEADFA